MKNKIIEISTTNNEKNTGSTVFQISALTNRMNHLTNHFRYNKKDRHSREGLLRMSSRRKKMLKYLQRVNISEYQDLLMRLKLRR